MNNKFSVPTTEQRVDAGNALSRIMFGGKNDDGVAEWLHQHLEWRLPGAEKILASDIDSTADEMPDEKLPGLLVEMFTTEIFAGGSKQQIGGYHLRDKILDILFEKGEYRKILDIWNGTPADKNTRDEKNSAYTKDKKGVAKKLVEELQCHTKTKWMPGKLYARRFVNTLRIPDIFAGIKSDPKLDRIQTAVPKANVKELKNFQKNMQAQIEQILDNPDMENNRAIVTLPTGAGKTRTVVEAIVQFLNRNGTERNILWIAQNQEVCEQAVICFNQIWEQKGMAGELEIFRAWGDNDIPNNEEHGIIVAGIQKLGVHMDELRYFYEQTNGKNMLSAVFIDEAHHSTTTSYREVLENLEMSPILGGTPKENDLVPLIGLTATPERKKDDETEKLSRMYGEKRIYPRENYKPHSDKTGEPFGNKWSGLRYMRDRLTKSRFLADATFWAIDPYRATRKEKDKRFLLTKSETDEQEKGKSDKWVTRLATETERNRYIKEEILKWAKKGKKFYTSAQT